MGTAAESSDEEKRLERLQALDVLDTPTDARFDSLTARALALFPGGSAAALSLVASKRVWFKSRIGLDVDQLPREVAFCSHTILNPAVLVVPDLSQDRRFARNILVTGDPRLRFYIGAPLTGQIGALCVIGTQPQQPTPRQIEGLARLALFADAQLLMCGALRTLGRASHSASLPV